MIDSIKSFLWIKEDSATKFLFALSFLKKDCMSLHPLGIPIYYFLNSRNL